MVLLYRKEETVTVYPADVVLFEGILMFYSLEIRDLFQMKLFVDTDADTRLSRRGEKPFKHQQMTGMLNISFFSHFKSVSFLSIDSQGSRHR